MPTPTTEQLRAIVRDKLRSNATPSLHARSSILTWHEAYVFADAELAGRSLANYPELQRVYKHADNKLHNLAVYISHAYHDLGYSADKTELTVDATVAWLANCFRRHYLEWTPGTHDYRKELDGDAPLAQDPRPPMYRAVVALLRCLDSFADATGVHRALWNTIALHSPHGTVPHPTLLYKRVSGTREWVTEMLVRLCVFQNPPADHFPKHVCTELGILDALTPQKVIDWLLPIHLAWTRVLEEVVKPPDGLNEDVAAAQEAVAAAQKAIAAAPEAVAAAPAVLTAIQDALTAVQDALTAVQDALTAAAVDVGAVHATITTLTAAIDALPSGLSDLLTIPLGKLREALELEAAMEAAQTSANLLIQEPRHERLRSQFERKLVQVTSSVNEYIEDIEPQAAADPPEITRVLSAVAIAKTVLKVLAITVKVEIETTARRDDGRRVSHNLEHATKVAEESFNRREGDAKRTAYVCWQILFRASDPASFESPTTQRKLVNQEFGYEFRCDYKDIVQNFVEGEVGRAALLPPTGLPQAVLDAIAGAGCDDNYECVSRYATNQSWKDATRAGHDIALVCTDGHPDLQETWTFQRHCRRVDAVLTWEQRLNTVAAMPDKCRETCGPFMWNCPVRETNGVPPQIAGRIHNFEDVVDGCMEVWDEHTELTTRLENLAREIAVQWSRVKVVGEAEVLTGVRRQIVGQAIVTGGRLAFAGEKVVHSEATRPRPDARVKDILRSLKTALELLDPKNANWQKHIERRGLGVVVQGVNQERLWWLVAMATAGLSVADIADFMCEAVALDKRAAKRVTDETLCFVAMKSRRLRRCWRRG